VATVIDALITTITLDPSGYKRGQDQVEKSNKAIKDDIRSLEDQIATIRQKSTKDTRQQDQAQILSLREVMRQKRRTLEDNKGREQEALKRTKEQAEALGMVKYALGEVAAIAGVATSVGAFAKFAIGIGAADAATQRFATNMGADMPTVNALGAALKQFDGDAKDAMAAYAALSNMRFGLQFGDAGATQQFGILSKVAAMGGVALTQQDLNNQITVLQKLAEAYASGRIKAQDFYQYLTRAGISAPVITALESGKSFAATLSNFKTSEGASSANATEDQKWQARVARAQSRFNGWTRKVVKTAEVDGDFLVDLLTLKWGNLAADRKAIGDEESAEQVAAIAGLFKKVGSRSLLDDAKEYQRIFGASTSAPASLTAQRAKFAVDYLKSQGISDAAATGAIAGAIAESKLDPNALGPMTKYGRAFGIGQWLDTPGSPRLSRLFAKYGKNPTFDQQLQYLVQELKGGDRGGAAVTGSGSAWDAAVAYIVKFMRPHAGAETRGDLTRARQALAALGVPFGLDPGLVTGAHAALGRYASAADARPTSVSNEVVINKLEVTVPPGSDGQKIAQDTASAVRHQPFVNAAMANYGLG
jgi:hypothetical protein